jgi:hypothetical protein
LKIRLIDPAYEHPYISHSQKVIKNIWFARLTLTTLAALTPPDIEVKITDDFEKHLEDFKHALAGSLRERGAKVEGHPSRKLLPAARTKVAPLQPK